MFDQLTNLVSEGSGWTYAVLLLFALGDSVIPILPSEAAVITGGVVAASGHLSLPLIIVFAAVGAFLGDNIAYLIGRKWGHRVTQRFFSGDKARKRIEWAESQLRARGGQLIAIGRFIPGGRTAVTLSAGTLGFPWRRFMAFDAIAAVVWASYAGLLGYLGGQAFKDSPWKGLVLAFGIAIAVTAVIELVRWARHRRTA